MIQFIQNNWDILFHFREIFGVDHHKNAIIKLDDISIALLHLHLHFLHKQANIIFGSTQRFRIQTLKRAQQLHERHFDLEKLRHRINRTNNNAVHIPILHQKRLLLNDLLQQLPRLSLIWLRCFHLIREKPRDLLREAQTRDQLLQMPQRVVQQMPNEHLHRHDQLLFLIAVLHTHAARVPQILPDLAVSLPNRPVDDRVEDLA